MPLLRRRLRIPAPVDGRRLRRRARWRSPSCSRARKRRDVALFAMQMWAFTMAHELPYDDPERLRARLRTRYPIAVDRAIGLGRLPNARLQRALARLPRVGAARPVPHLGPLALVPRALPRRCSASSSATTSASRARPARWPPSSTSAAPSTSRCRPRRPGGPPSRA